MLKMPQGVRIYVALLAVNMRKYADGLSVVAAAKKSVARPYFIAFFAFTIDVFCNVKVNKLFAFFASVRLT
ncbi:MAG: hypothetical protein JXA30_22705 [Deltaproteobacteria bacterium]|nr:hypothetical protein [Deltaproteobacteria bacterium]